MPAAARLPLVTLAALFVGYACSYFHRSDLATLAPLLAVDPARAALRAALPDIASLGMLVYAVGKVVGGLLAERLGGRRLLVAALAGAGLAELAAARATTPVDFASCRVVGMLVLGCAWPAVGHVVASATPRQRLATVMAFVSQSYLLGDAMVRAVLAAVVANGGTTPTVLGTSATGLLGASVLVGGLLWFDQRRRGAAAAGSGSPEAAGPPPAARPAAPVAARAAAPPTASPRGERPVAPAVPPPRVAPPFAAPDAALPRLLVALAAMNFGLAMVRESLSLWLPLLLVERCGAALDDAVRASALLPLASGVGALVAGPVADRGARALLAVTALPAALAALVLGALATAAAPAFATVVVAVALASALLAMPMTLASGVLPLRAAASGGARRLGFVDGAGSSGAVLAGGALARVDAAWGTSGMFALLAAVAGVAAVIALQVPRAHRAQ